MTMRDRLPLPRSIVIGALILAGVLILQVAALHVMGRDWICRCGEIKLWENEIYSAGNSQHLADWYTPTHLEHGFLFFALAWLFLRRYSLTFRLGAALALEAAWEILENSPIIIDRYRAETISLDYYGDSILNSASDTVFMVIGFLIAARLPVWATVCLAILLEGFLAWMIRDNLVLNIEMLVWPLDVIRDWQSAIAPHG